VKNKQREFNIMVNIGIIGAGRIGKVHARSILTGVDCACIKAIADPFITEDTEKWAKSAGIENVYLDHKQIIGDPDIDAVLICSSTDTHTPISLEAIHAGKHVFCEKPIDHSLEKIKQVMEALEVTNLKYQVGFNRRFDHNFKAVRKAVADGKIGDVHIVKITSRDPEPPPLSYVKSSGGLFMDMMIHDFDMVRYLTGSEPVEIFAAGGVLIDPKIGEAGDVDTAVVTIKMENGAFCVIDNSRKSVYGYDQRAEVFGNLGCVAIGNDTDSTAVISTVSGVCGEKPKWFFLERYMQAYQDEIISFVKAIEEDKPTEVGVFDGLQPVRMAVAAKKSLIENRVVKLSEITI
jgi:myo-inositol 2-dehydrogenase/D-chiro-inositol 1-dehydrogenase